MRIFMKIMVMFSKAWSIALVGTIPTLAMACNYYAGSCDINTLNQFLELLYFTGPLGFFTGLIWGIRTF